MTFVVHHSLVAARLDVCAVGVDLRQVGRAVTDEVDKHGLQVSCIFAWNE